MDIQKIKDYFLKYNYYHCKIELGYFTKDKSYKVHSIDNTSVCFYDNNHSLKWFVLNSVNDFFEYNRKIKIKIILDD
jgi:hypothetical protein